jgi:hypothetical protein
MPLFTSWFFFLTAWSQQTENSEKIIANAHMPAITKDKENNIHIVYANGDSILYVFSKDGKSYSTPALVAVLPDLWTQKENRIVMKPNGQKIFRQRKFANIKSDQ